MNHLSAVIISATLTLLLAGCDHKSSPATIAGGSMYPGLLGQHYSTACPDCGFSFSIDAHKPPRSGLAVCPNCGCDTVQFADLQTSENSAVEIVSGGQAPTKRWERVAFTDPSSQDSGGNQQSRKIVKRIVGLPSEDISISNGNLFADGQILSKPWDCLLYTSPSPRDRG